jgi:hypothetical protein
MNPQFLYDCLGRAPLAKLDIAAGHARRMQMFWFLIINHIQLSWIASPLLYAIVGLAV